MKIHLTALCFLPALLFSQSVEEGKTEVQNGHIARAKEIFEAVLTKDSKNAEAHYQLGAIELRGDFRDEDGAVDHMERATELDEQNADYQSGYGMALGLKAQSAGVIKQAFLAPKVKNAFQRALELNPRLVQARVGLAQYYIKAPSIMGGDEEKGWKHLDTVITLDEYIGRMTKVGLFISDKKIDKAEAEVKLLATKYPGDWRVWNSLTNFYIRRNRGPDAIASAQRCVQLKPDTAESYKNLGQAKLLNGEYDAALTNLKKALSLNKNHLMATYFLAKTYGAKGMKQEAKESFQRVLQLDPPDGLRKDVEKNLKEISS